MRTPKIQSAAEWSHIDRREEGNHYEYVETDNCAYRLTVTSGIGYFWIVEHAIACNWHLCRMSQVYFTDFAPALEQGRTALRLIAGEVKLLR